MTFILTALKSSKSTIVSSRNLRTPAVPVDLMLLNKLTPFDNIPARPLGSLADPRPSPSPSPCVLSSAMAKEVEEEEEDETALSMLLRVWNTSAYLSCISSLYVSSYDWFNQIRIRDKAIHVNFS